MIKLKGLYTKLSGTHDVTEIESTTAAITTKEI